MALIENRLVALMPEPVQVQLAGLSVEFSNPEGHPIPRQFQDGGFVHIVESGAVSKFLLSPTGHLSEVGIVGNEGLFPISGLLGVEGVPCLSISQLGEVRGRRLRTTDFHRILDECSRSSHLVKQFVFSFMTQVGSNIMATDQAMVRARIARWLLMCHDRIDGNYLPVTHDSLAQMAGAHRPTVSKTLQELRDEGHIDMARGMVTILSRAGLRNIADGSYGQSEAYWQQHIGPFGKSDEDGGNFDDRPGHAGAAPEAA